MTPDRWADLAAALAVGALFYAGTWAAIRLALWALERLDRPAPGPTPSGSFSYQDGPIAPGTLTSRELAETEDD